jgi:transcriptional regulator with XRE-family HTH domain
MAELNPTDTDARPITRGAASPETTHSTGADDGVAANMLRRWVGARLREWRMRRGMTQAAVARESRIDQSSLSNYETGKRDIPTSAVLRLMATLNVSLGDLVEISRSQQEVIVARDSLLGEAVSRLIAGREDVARAEANLEVSWLASRRARAAVAAAASDGADIAIAAAEAVDQALALAAEHGLDPCEVARAAARGAIEEASLTSAAAAKRVEAALASRWPSTEA